MNGEAKFTYDNGEPCHRRLLVICCFGRSGSSLIWHALASSPDAIALDGEFHGILFGHGRLARMLFRSAASRLPDCVSHYLASWAWKRLLLSAERSIGREPYVWKTRDQCYETGTTQQYYLCFKLMGQDVKLVEFLRNHFDDVRFVGFVRDGRAILEGWQRRGMPVKLASSRYRKVCEEMLRQALAHEDFHLVRYEDYVANPFGETQRLWETLGLKSRSDGQLMVKVKGFTTSTGYRHVASDQSIVRYIAAEEAAEIIVGDVNQAQIARLSSSDLSYFVGETRDVLEQFGYLQSEN